MHPSRRRANGAPRSARHCGNASVRPRQPLYHCGPRAGWAQSPCCGGMRVAALRCALRGTPDRSRTWWQAGPFVGGSRLPTVTECRLKGPPRTANVQLHRHWLGGAAVRASAPPPEALESRARLRAAPAAAFSLSGPKPSSVAPRSGARYARARTQHDRCKPRRFPPNNLGGCQAPHPTAPPPGAASSHAGRSGLAHGMRHAAPSRPGAGGACRERRSRTEAAPCAVWVPAHAAAPRPPAPARPRAAPRADRSHTLARSCAGGKRGAAAELPDPALKTPIHPSVYQTLGWMAPAGFKRRCWGVRLVVEWCGELAAVPFGGRGMCGEWPAAMTRKRTHASTRANTGRSTCHHPNPITHPTRTPPRRPTATTPAAAARSCTRASARRCEAPTCFHQVRHLCRQPRRQPEAQRVREAKVWAGGKRRRGRARAES